MFSRVPQVAPRASFRSGSLPIETQTVTVESEFQVAASDWLRFTNQPGFQIGDWASLRISGRVEVVRTAAAGGDESALGAWGRGGQTLVLIEAGGSLEVRGIIAGAPAFGIMAAPSGGPSVMNRGAIVVTAEGPASGVVNGMANDSLFNDGRISVTSTMSDATGVRFDGFDQRVTNNGDIIATGHGKVIGIDMGFSGGQTLVNKGTIVARDDSDTTLSVGVSWRGDFTGVSFVNDGRIEADRALDIEAGFSTDAVHLFTNNGVLAGEVWMGGGHALTLVNNGEITGPIRMINAGSLYDGRLGVARAPITTGTNGQVTLLGGQGDETMTGWVGPETISGGGGDDVIDGGDGVNKLDGGDGMDTVSFASVGNPIRADLATGIASFPFGETTFSGFERLIGSRWNDELRAGASSSVAGGQGADTITGAATGTTYLRGDEGDDSIVGGSGFDDINGNMGNDTCVSGGGDDWVVGGKGNDSLVGSAGQNLVYGNIGDDTCEGGEGNDIVRGGQDNDMITGGAGDDYVSGDRGSDTVAGGAGADLFHTFGDAGVDRVTDFSLAQGDRVQLDPGTQYSVSQVGADTVINMAGGGQMILVGVQMSSLPSDWIFGA